MLFSEMLVFPPGSSPDSLMRPPENNIWQRDFHWPHRRVRKIHPGRKGQISPFFLAPHHKPLLKLSQEDLAVSAITQ